MTLGGAAQVAAAHCPNERTLDPAVCSQTDPTMPLPATLWPSVVKTTARSTGEEEEEEIILPNK